MQPRIWIAALRPTHWIKNLLLVAPVLSAHVDPSLDMIGRLALGILLMSFAASSGYLVNDLRDHVADRQHAYKHKRPVAAGKISRRDAALMALFLGWGAISLSCTFFGSKVGMLLAAYMLLTVSYSFFFKRLPVVDVLILAALYVWRLMIGAEIAGIDMSPWLLVFGYSLFVALALVKRVDELAALDVANSTALAGRAYRRNHLSAVLSFSVIFALFSLAILAAYIGFSEAAKAYYHARSWLWVATALLGLWLARLLRRSAAGRLGGDPMVFAASDPVSLALAVCVTVTFIAAA